MHANSNRRAMALLHLVCISCVSRLTDRLVPADAELGRDTLRKALKDSVDRLLDAPDFSRNPIDEKDLSWRGKDSADRSSRNTPDSSDDDKEAEVDQEYSKAVDRPEDWSNVGYDPKYRTIRRLTAQEELRFVVLAKAGDRFAQQKLILHHLPLLKMVARRYSDRGLSLSELVNEGIFGLVRSIDRFEIERQFRFGTYAKWWIRDAIEQALLRQSRLIRLPGHIVRARNERWRAEALSGGTPASDLEGSAHEAAEVLPWHEADDYGNAEIAWDEQGQCRSEGVEDATPETVFDDKQRQALLERALAQLSERECQVVVRRFGLHNDTPDTLEAVAADLNISYERVRQIQKSALIKLRSFLAPHFFSSV